MKHRLELGAAGNILRAAQQETAAALRGSEGREALLETKRQIDLALRCLALCQTYQIHPDSEIDVLPWPSTAYGEFALFDLDESGMPTSARPLHLAGRELSCGAGDLVVRVRHGFNLPEGEKK